MTRDAAQARERKARAFADAAKIVKELDSGERELDDVYVTLCVHAGIAAADAICLRRLGRAHQGRNHDEAAEFLGGVDAQLKRHLAALLGMKTRAAYSTLAVRSEDIARAGRAMQALLDAIRP